jgi:membrane protein
MAKADRSPKNSWLALLARFWNPAFLHSWARPYRRMAGMRAFGVRQVEVFVTTARSVVRDEITRRAAALTYHTMVSLVPLLAVGFAIFQSFGGLKKYQEPLRDLIVDNLAAGRAQEVGQWIDQFISNISAGAIAGIGVVFLFYSAIGLLTNIEGSFNRIWHIQRGRSPLQRVMMYWLLLTLTPPLLGIALSMSARLQSHAYAMNLMHWLPFGLGRLLVSLTTVFTICLAFTLSYLIVPNIRVRIRAALLGGVVAGVLWSILKALFISFTANSIKYSAVYGALSALPVLMIWIYLSWIIVLFGATYAYANQSVVTQGLEQHDIRMCPAFKELLVVRIMAVVAEAFERKEPPPTLYSLSRRLDTMITLVQQVTDLMVEHDLLEECGGKHEGAFRPGRSLERISLHEIQQVLRWQDGNTFHLEITPLHERVQAILAEAEGASRKVLEGTTLRDLITEEGKAP